MPETVLNFGAVYTPFARLDRASIRIENGVVKSVKPYWVEGGEDFKEYTAVPAFVDTHMHGCCGYDTNRVRSEDDLKSMAKNLLRFGVGAFVPTTVTAPHEELLRVAEVVGGVAGSDTGGAEVLGLHLEGPYINPEKRGAQNPEFIRRPSIGELEEYYKASHGKLLIIDVAPEVEGALELIAHARRLGIHVGMGHTNATYEEAVRGIEAGCDRAVHIFNGMRGFHHREPGVVLAALENPHVYVEVITDFIHLHPATVRLVIGYARWTRTVLITDAISATALPDGAYELGGLKVIVKNGIARLEDGTLAGSTLTMDRAVRNVHSLGIELSRVLAMASYVPARSIGAERYGCLVPGCYANIAVLDSELNVVATIIRGDVRYRRA